MKANSRRRVLISSMAMLLVALVALGTATYAWFTSSTQATADQLSVKTIKASTLEVATKDTSTWGTTVHYMDEGVVKTLLPASSVNGVNWFTANAADSKSYAADGDFVSLSNTDNYVYIDELNIRNAGEAAVENVEIKFSISETGSTGLQYARVALVPISAAGAAIDTTADGFDFSDYVYDADGDTVLAAASATGTGSVSATDATSIVTIDVTAKKDGDTPAEKLAGVTKDDEGKITAYDTRSYKVLVWFEGQDGQCSDANAGNQVPNISFTVSADVADQV